MAPVITLSPDDTEGYWGMRTSTLDWCEENYAVTVLIAEFWNTISNWIMIIPPLVAAYVAWKDKMELRIFCSFISFAAVGFGSLSFHCTLLYEMQLLDELPMIYGTCIFLYSQMECNGKENKPNKKLVLLFFVVSIGVTVIYVTVPNPAVFQTAYAILATVLFFQMIYRCRKFGGSTSLAACSLLSYGMGFVLWNIDNNFCPSIRTARMVLPSFIKPVTQLHAWWHILAGTGTYLSNIYTVHLRMKCLGYPTKLELFWNCIPVFRKLDKKKTESSSSLNGKQKYKENGVLLNNNYK